MPKKQAISKEERKWRARDDAEIMQRYAEIAADKTRLKDAKQSLKQSQAKINKAINMIDSPQKAKK